MLTHFQVCLFLILLIVERWTPYSSAISRSENPSECLKRTSSIFSSESLAWLCRSPFGEFFLSLPFAFISSELSLYVPRKRCAGFTQRRLSHECNTQMSSIESSDSIWKETRCARTGKHLSENCPYPLFPISPAFQFQQCSGSPLSTFTQNRAFSRSVNSLFTGIRRMFMFIAKFYKTERAKSTLNRRNWA